MGILVAVDDTDHLDFYCPECDGGMDVTDVGTKLIVPYGTCTWIHLKCKKCKYEWWRKFWWDRNEAEQDRKHRIVSGERGGGHRKLR